MAWKNFNCSILIAVVCALGILLSGAPSAVSRAKQPADTALVRVIITTRTRGTVDTVEINGKLLRDYSPVLIQVFSSIGIVLDRHDYIMAFLGYRWIDVQGRDTSVEVVSGEGQKQKGQLIGIDQNNGAAVVRLLEGRLKETPVCIGCEVKDGAVVMAPSVAGRGPSPLQLNEARVVSAGAKQTAPDAGRWTITVSRPFPDIGQPILDSDHRVLGFVSNQDPSSAQTSIYPIAQLLSSAGKIIHKGGDIQVGWLGVFIVDPPIAGSGVKVEDVGQDSPAQKAGLSANDVITGYNGRQVKDSLQFIQLVESTPIKSKVRLDILRGGKPLTVAAVIESFKPQQMPGKLTFNLPEPPSPQVPRPVAGLDTIMLNPYLAKELKTSREEGLLVVGVGEQSPAELAGVLVGDIVIAIDEKTIKDAASFSAYLQTLNWGARMTVRVLRKGSEHTISVHLPNHP
jgi:S1-C subfamily serine protease